MVILTSHDSVQAPPLLEMLAAKGIEKFIAYELPLDLVKERYGGHFSLVAHDLKEPDALRVLDFNGTRAFRLFSLSEMSNQVMHEGP
jgi:hypothetical protein